MTLAANHEFQKFSSIPRMKRGCVITEKIDGSNAQILVTEDGDILAGSRNRWITPDDDNFGFARWVHDNAEGLVAELGIGRHYGEWWGQGIQRRYGQNSKHFSLFNAGRHDPETLKLCRVVPTLYTGQFDTAAIDETLLKLKYNGSYAAPGFMDPEGIVVFHTQSKSLYKITLDANDQHKGQVQG